MRLFSPSISNTEPSFSAIAFRTDPESQLAKSKTEGIRGKIFETSLFAFKSFMFQEKNLFATLIKIHVIKFFMQRKQPGPYASRRGNGIVNGEDSTADPANTLFDSKPQDRSIRPRNSVTVGVSSSTSLGSSGIRTEQMPQLLVSDASVNAVLQLKIDLAEERSLSALVRSVGLFLVDTNGPSVESVMRTLDAYKVRETLKTGSDEEYVMKNSPFPSSRNRAALSVDTATIFSETSDIGKRLVQKRRLVNSAKRNLARVGEYEDFSHRLVHKRCRPTLEGERCRIEASVRRLSDQIDVLSRNSRNHAVAIAEALHCISALQGSSIS
jgi:hypothetical protein